MSRDDTEESAVSAEPSPSPQQLTAATRAINSQAALVQLGRPRVDDREQRKPLLLC